MRLCSEDVQDVAASTQFTTASLAFWMNLAYGSYFVYKLPKWSLYKAASGHGSTGHSTPREKVNYFHLCHAIIAGFIQAGRLVYAALYRDH